MKGVPGYFEGVRRLIQALPRVEIERYEEQLFSEDRGNLRTRLRFADNSLLEISEAIHIVGGKLTWLSYRYHYQEADGGVIFRYDNTPHHPNIPTFPDHKHIKDSVISAARPDIEMVLSEAKEHLGGTIPKTSHEGIFRR